MVRNKLDELWMATPGRPEPEDAPAATAVASNGATGRNPAYATAALTDELNALARTTEGARNDQLNTSAFNLGQIIGAGALDETDVRDRLTAVAHAIGLTVAETRATITSGLTDGKAHPRHIPVATSTGQASSQVDIAAAEDIGETVEKLFPIIDWHQLWDSEDEEEWIIEPLLPARRAVALYSAPKVGKSLLMLEIAAGIARGTEVLGVTPSRAWRVLYVDFENDPRGDVRTRLQSMEIGPDQLGNLCYLSFPALAKLDTPMGGMQLVAVAQHHQCEVVVIDTVSRAIEGEENANDTWLSFYRNTGLALKALGIACIRLDHTGKNREKGMRGGSAKYGDVDAVWKLEMTTDTTFMLECTDHRMPIPEPILALSREDYPLCHKIVGTHWSDVLDSQAERVDRDLDDLGVPASASVRDCGRALREGGRKVRQAVLVRAVRIRKVRLDVTTEGGR